MLNSKKIIGGLFSAVLAIAMTMQITTLVHAMGNGPSYSLAIGSSMVSGSELSLSGTASATNFAGQFNHYTVQVDWGDSSNGVVSNTLVLASSSFSGGWSGTHNYMTSGQYTVTATLCHQSCNGAEGSKATQSVQVEVVVPEATGELTVTKVVSGGELAVEDFSLYVGTTSVSSGATNEFPVGNYTVSEDEVAGYSASFSGDCDGSGNVTLEEDDDLTCTITNTYVGTGDDDDDDDMSDDDDDDSDSVTIIAHKIVCDDESYLPNWGAIGATVDENTAADFVDENSEHCWFAEDWDFQWHPGKVKNSDENDIFGEVAGWTTFGPTNENGMISTLIDISELNAFSIREVLQEGFIPFTFWANGKSNADDYSAELYCSTTNGNYDNMEWVDELTVDEDYYCVAFNYEVPEPASLEITYPSYEGEEVTKGSMVDLTALYFDDDEVTDVVNFAVKAGTCEANTPGANVAGYLTSDNNSTYDPETGEFVATVDLSDDPAGEYCFVVNPVEQFGEENLRATRTFTLVEEEILACVPMVYSMLNTSTDHKGVDEMVTEFTVDGVVYENGDDFPLFVAGDADAEGAYSDEVVIERTADGFELYFYGNAPGVVKEFSGKFTLGGVDFSAAQISEGNEPLENNGKFDDEIAINTTTGEVTFTLYVSTGNDSFIVSGVTLDSSCPFDPYGIITNPEDGSNVSGQIDLTAEYFDGDDENDDIVQWAVRKGSSCSGAQNTVVGNVDGFSDLFSWDGSSFSAPFDSTLFENGEYCFIFNPKDDGDVDVRETSVFTINNQSGDDDDDDDDEPIENLIVVSGDTSAGENQPGWLFNRDVNTQTPYEFNTVMPGIGIGSLNVLPISGDDPLDKFIAENFLQAPIGDINSITYDFKIGDGGTFDDDNDFYMNVYMNFGESDPNKYYDCRYDIVPTTGANDAWTTVTFDPTQSYPVTERASSPYDCPSAPADMDLASPGSVIRMFALNVGDTSANDDGLDGFLDNVVVNTDDEITTYDFEPATQQGDDDDDDDDDIVVTSGDDDDDDDEENRSGSSRRSGSSGGGQVLGAATGVDSCEMYLGSYMRETSVNDAGEVALLQVFLNVQGYAVPVTGFFGPLTTGAVNQFQLAHAGEILQPWANIGYGDGQTPTGWVYKTTRWKINDTVCPGSESFPILP